MKKLSSYYFIFLLSFLTSNGQQIKFYSNQDNIPLKNVLLFDTQGLLITNSDENGIVDTKLLSENEPYYIANYNNVVQDTIRIKEIKNNSVFLDTKIINLSEIVVSKKGKDSEIIVVEGYFNNILTNEKRVTGYIEGIVQYLFDYNTKKYKDKKLLQYRVFKVENSNMNSKEVGTYDFDSYKLPDIKKITEPSALKSKYSFDEKIDSQGFKDINLTKIVLKEEDTFKLFGFVFTNFYEKINATYDSNDLNVNNLIFYSCIESVDAKRKSEEKFNTIRKIINFYPTNLYYITKKEEKDTKEVSLNKNYSKYSTLFWQFVPMYKNVKKYSPLSFIEGLKELENKQQ